jgi:hypothetical protein
MTTKADAAAANNAEVRKSIDAWRAMQGLPPMSKEETHGHEQVAQDGGQEGSKASRARRANR